MSGQRQENSALRHYHILALTEGGCMLHARMLAALEADVIKIRHRCQRNSNLIFRYFSIL